MAQAPLQHSCGCNCCWPAISGEQDPGEEARIRPVDPGEWLLMCEWESGGGPE